MASGLSFNPEGAAFVVVVVAEIVSSQSQADPCHFVDAFLSMHKQYIEDVSDKIPLQSVFGDCQSVSESSNENQSI
jgi:hypothetical protein